MTKIIQYPLNLCKRNLTEAFIEDEEETVSESEEESTSQGLKNKLILIDRHGIETFKGDPVQTLSCVDEDERMREEIIVKFLSMNRRRMEAFRRHVEETESVEEEEEITCQAINLKIVPIDRRQVETVAGDPEETVSCVEEESTKGNLEETVLCVEKDVWNTDHELPSTSSNVFKKRKQEMKTISTHEIRSQPTEEDPEETISCVEENSLGDLKEKFLSIGRRHIETFEGVIIDDELPCCSSKVSKQITMWSEEDQNRPLNLKKKFLSTSKLHSQTTEGDCEEIVSFEEAERSSRQDMSTKQLLKARSLMQSSSENSRETPMSLEDKDNTTQMWTNYMFLLHKHIMKALKDNRKKPNDEEEMTFQDICEDDDDDCKESEFRIEEGATIKELKTKLAFIDKYISEAFGEDAEKTVAVVKDGERNTVPELENEELSNDTPLIQTCNEDPEKTVTCMEKEKEEENIPPELKQKLFLTDTDEFKMLDIQIKKLEDWYSDIDNRIKKLLQQTIELENIEIEIEELEEFIMEKNININKEEFEKFCKMEIAEENPIEPTNSSAEPQPQTAKREEQQTNKVKPSATSTPIVRKSKANSNKMAKKFEANENGMVVIGPNGTTIAKKALQAINWSLSGAAVTRKILVEVFGRETLAFHTLTGKPSPAFMDCDKPMKNQLDPLKVEDVLHLVMQHTQLTAKEVRNAITTKCADENKMFRQREKKRLNAAPKLQKKAKNKLDLPLQFLSGFSSLLGNPK